MKKIRLTYFTPTYNREKLLPKLYESLLAQTNKNFIWLVIDDGSKDNTETLVLGWKKDNKIQIEYVKKENGGKHTAIELSNQICTTEFITCVDSDDFLTPNATEVLYSKFDLCEKADTVGIVGPRNQINSKTNEIWNLENEPLFFYDIKNKLGVLPETILVFKTEIAKQYHFPIIPTERFVTEEVYYRQFFYKYQFIPIKEKIYVAEYLEDGYTNMGLTLFKKNPVGYACCLRQTACMTIKNKSGFKENLKKIRDYYGWKSLHKTKDKHLLTEYKIPFPYNFIGWLTTPISKHIIKKWTNNN